MVRGCMDGTGCEGVGDVPGVRGVQEGSVCSALQD